MGYTSEVAIAIPNEAFCMLVGKARTECGEAYELIKSGAVYRTDTFTTIYFDCIKWYDYPEIQFIENYMRGVPYVFNRVGEDYDDIESAISDVSDYALDSCVRIVRKLDIDDAGDRLTVEEIESINAEGEVAAA